jgi:hypothetical protein
MPSAEFEPATQVTKRQQTYALDRAATGISTINIYIINVLISQMMSYFACQYANYLILRTISLLLNQLIRKSSDEICVSVCKSICQEPR